MKYKVIKEYAGIEVGSEVKIADGAVKYMVTEGYVEPIETTVTAESMTDEPAHTEQSHAKPAIDKPARAQNKAIEPKYKRNKQ